MHLAIAWGKKEFLRCSCLKWKKVKSGKSRFSWWVSLCGIMLERNEGVLYLLGVIIKLYRWSCHDILKIIQRSVNFKKVYFPSFYRELFNFHILCGPCTYMHIWIGTWILKYGKESPTLKFIRVLLGKFYSCKSAVNVFLSHL